MRRQTIAAVLFSIAVSLGAGTAAQAGSIIATTTFAASNQTSPPDTTDYEGIFYDGSSTFPPSSTSIGTFSFTIPKGDLVLGATLSGTFGDVNIPVTALTDLFVLGGSIEVANCDVGPNSTYPPCAAGSGSPVSWSYTFSSADLSSLASDFSAGSIDFTAIQNSPFGAIVVGSPALTIQVTPEPASILSLAGGLLALAAFRRRK